MISERKITSIITIDSSNCDTVQNLLNTLCNEVIATRRILQRWQTDSNYNMKR